MPKTEMRIDKRSLNLRTMGISNWCLDENKKRYSIQFYDLDHDTSKGFNVQDFNKIMGIFPYDCLMYETKHGTQFISFAILHGLNYTKAKSIKLSKELGTQDYWTTAKDLTLRVAPKWKKRFLRKREIISKKPIFKGILKCPDKHIISEKHLEFYLKYMNLPKEIHALYDDCDKQKLRIKIYHYKTRD